MRALKNPTNLSSWRAWEGEAYRRSGFAVIMAGFFAPMTVAFAVFPSLFGRALGDDLVRVSLIGLILYLGTCSALMALAVWRMNSWKRANPWTPPS